MSNKRIAKNFVLILLAESVRSVFQFFFIKRLTNTLSNESYGEYLSVFNTISLLYIIIHFGLEMYGTREIAKNPEKASVIIGDILQIRIILFFITLGILFLYLNAGLGIASNYFYYFAAIKLLGDAILINWFFQGIEDFKTLAYRQMLLFPLMLGSLYLFVNYENDLFNAILVNSITYLSLSILLIITYLRKAKIHFSINFNRWKTIINQSFPMGIMFFMVIIYTRSDIELIKQLIPNSAYKVSLYGATVALITIAAMVSSLLQQVFFPRISRTNDKEFQGKVLSYYFDISLLVGVLFTLLIYTFPSELLLLQFKSSYLEAESLLKFFAFKIMLIYFVVSLSTPFLANGQQKIVMVITIFSALLNIIGNLVLIPIYDIYGAAYSTVASEIFVGIALIYTIYKRKIHYNYLQLIYYLIALISTILLLDFVKQFTSSLIIVIFVFISCSILIFLTLSKVKISELKSIIRK
jgi:O-antigen/teichoic acid export membrane protein